MTKRRIIDDIQDEMRDLRRRQVNRLYCRCGKAYLDVPWNLTVLGLLCTQCENQSASNIPPCRLARTAGGRGRMLEEQIRRELAAIHRRNEMFWDAAAERDCSHPTEAERDRAYLLAVVDDLTKECERHRRG